MAFSTEWDSIYRKHEQMTSWPWTDLISLVHRHCIHLVSNKGNALELGCGSGANIPFFKALGVNYFGIDGSQAVINHLRERYPELQQQIICEDFTVIQPFDMKYDLIFDRAAVTHNNSKSIQRTLDIALNSLNFGGTYIGVDYFSTKHSDFNKGSPMDDPFTRNGYVEGQFTGCGNVHFFNEAHIRDLFNDYEIIYLSEKIVREFEPKGTKQFASWNIVARKI